MRTLEGLGKRRSANANVVGGGLPMPLSPEAPKPMRIRHTTTGIHTSVTVLSVSGGRRITLSNNWRRRQQRGRR